MENRFRVSISDYKWMIYYAGLMFILYFLNKYDIFNEIVFKLNLYIILIWIVVLALLVFPVIKMWAYIYIHEDHLVIEQQGHKTFIQKTNIQTIQVYEKRHPRNGSSSYWMTIKLVNSHKKFFDYRLNFRRKYYKVIKELVRKNNYPIV